MLPASTRLASANLKPPMRFRRVGETTLKPSCAPATHATRLPRAVHFCGGHAQRLVTSPHSAPRICHCGVATRPHDCNLLRSSLRLLPPALGVSARC
eukprot:366256-Chlamydomonas_euryale.AAC.3